MTGMPKGHVRNKRRLCLAALLSFFVLVAQSSITSAATVEEREILFKTALQHPTDTKATLAYVEACVALQDYEGAIGGLERILYYYPNDAKTKAEIGLLYNKLHSHLLARHYFDSALGDPALDSLTRHEIETLETAGPGDGSARQGVFGSLQTGLRSQSNPAFNPDNATLRLAGQDFTILNPQKSGSDGNWFGIAQLGYDYDLGNQRGDVVETRFTGYLTRQFHFADLNVGLFDISIGPRLALAPDSLPGWTVKPYVAAGQVWLAGARYETSGGFGLVADIPVSDRLSLQPGAEVRYANFASMSVLSSLSTGDVVSASIAGQAALTGSISMLSTLSFSRSNANMTFQSLDCYGEQFALVDSFAVPLNGATSAWSVSPYLKLLQTVFDAANPYIDPNTARRDSEWQAGVVFDTPLSSTFGFVTNVQYAKVTSNIPNYREHNFSVLSGPTVRF